ncbi:MAG TPA: hypothetical protein VFY82_08075 [Acidimicrobiales bacterium]|nr:hypothetical protein [Acidimicrobiales bacterium]
MSTEDRVTYSDPAMPGMTFGRPPTRPSRPRAVDDSDHEPARVDGGVNDGETEPAPDIPVSADDGVVAPVTASDPDEVDESARRTAAGRPDDGPILSTDQIAGLRRRWGAVQAGFVDDPRRAVEVADDIVAEAVVALQAAIDERRREVAEPWREDADASTDALLVAFHSYRSVFERVLSS